MYWNLGKFAPVEALAIAAHPDDIELHCGGTLAALTASGMKVAVIDCSEAELSTNGTIELRRQECATASKILGIHARLNLQFPDGQLPQQNDLSEHLVLAIRQFRPRLLFTFCSHTRHSDHRAVHHAVKDAFFLCGVQKFHPEIPHCPRPQRVMYFHEVEEQHPALLIDVSAFIENKQKSILAYASQFSPEPGRTATMINSGFVERILRRNRLWGDQAGVQYAEPFSLDSPPLIHAEHL